MSREAPLDIQPVLIVSTRDLYEIEDRDADISVYRFGVRSEIAAEPSRFSAGISPGDGWIAEIITTGIITLVARIITAGIIPCLVVSGRGVVPRIDITGAGVTIAGQAPLLIPSVRLLPRLGAIHLDVPLCFILRITPATASATRLSSQPPDLGHMLAVLAHG